LHGKPRKTVRSGYGVNSRGHYTYPRELKFQNAVAKFSRSVPFAQKNLSNLFLAVAIRTYR
jgi:hypothetical protein